MADPGTTRSSGDKGEKIACQFLKSKGFTILEQNWRSSTLEIDIIGSNSEVMVFVEVKFRKDSKYGEPVEFISEQKMMNMSIAAGRYIQENEYSGSIRFDIIGIRPDGKGHYKIRHLEDVHFPGWDP